jgi:DNA-binding MarR family transcriptional regulator
VRKPSREEGAFLDLLRTTDILTRGMARVLKPEDLSMTQYNVLRILRGSPDGLASGEIGNRLITRDPDITRLLDRLEKRGLISRQRPVQDRRTVMAKITPAGIALVDRLDGLADHRIAAFRRQLFETRRDQNDGLHDSPSHGRTNRVVSPQPNSPSEPRHIRE